MRETELVPDVPASQPVSARSYAPIIRLHLHRLVVLANADHARFTRSDGRPEYRNRRVAVALAQGAALHFVNGINGVKDLDVWTFYAPLPGIGFPADKRETHADFGPSEFGRQLYDFHTARNDAERARWRRWNAYTGRRVDFLMRALAVSPDSDATVIIAALRKWLTAGSLASGAKKPSAWHLARKAAVLLWPDERQGTIIWPPP